MPTLQDFSSKLCDECLNEHWFRTLQQARTLIRVWRWDYNERRPHTSLGYLSPAQFAPGQRQQSVDFLERQLNEQLLEFAKQQLVLIFGAAHRNNELRR